jgi:hypothetical protein
LRTQAADAATLGSSERRNSTATGAGTGGSTATGAAAGDPTATGAGGGSDAALAMPGVDGDRSTNSNGQSAEAAVTGSPKGEERLPGMDPIWQAENGAWPPLNLGPGGWGGPTEYVPPGDSGPLADGASATPPTTPPTTLAGAAPTAATGDPPEPPAAASAEPDPSSTPATTPEPPALTDANPEQVRADVPSPPTPDDIDPEITSRGTTEL